MITSLVVNIKVINNVIIFPAIQNNNMNNNIISKISNKAKRQINPNC
jgi:hypothetical protein